jgi:hypothetical protein
MASQMHKVPGIHWPSESGLAAALQQEPLRLNPLKLLTPLDQLKSLYSDTTIGGILLMTMHYYLDCSSVSKPYITIVGTPLIMPLGYFSAKDPPGINYANIWDNSVLAPHLIPISKTLHCPLLAAVKGLSRAVKLPGIVMWIFYLMRNHSFPPGQTLGSPHLDSNQYCLPFILPTRSLRFPS